MYKKLLHVTTKNPTLDYRNKTLIELKYCPIKKNLSPAELYLGTLLDTIGNLNTSLQFGIPG